MAIIILENMADGLPSKWPQQSSRGEMDVEHLFRLLNKSDRKYLLILCKFNNSQMWSVTIEADELLGGLQISFSLWLTERI